MRRASGGLRSALMLILGGAMIAGSGEARAGAVLVFKGKITQGSGTGGDPSDTITVDLFLQSGSIPPDLGAGTTTFTVRKLVGVSGQDFASYLPSPSTTSQPPTTGAAGSLQAMEFWSVPTGGIVTSTIPSPAPLGYVPDGYNYQADVTWEYVLGPTINYDATKAGPFGMFIGEFTVVTSWSYTATQPFPIPPGTTINVDYEVGGTPGQTSFQISVPEPSSIVMMLVGGAFLPMAAWSSRRRGRGQSSVVSGQRDLA